MSENCQDNCVEPNKLACNATIVEEFKTTLNMILDKILTESTDIVLNESLDLIREIYDYNVVNGKQIRGLLVVEANHSIAKIFGKELLKEDTMIANTIGWTLEVLQAFALILDDIMDESKTRRGQICWYRKKGMLAISDALLLEQHAYLILKIFISEKPYYIRILDLFHQMSLMTVYGQYMDVTVGFYPGHSDQLEKFTESLLEAIYKYKTSFYTLVFPFRIALILNCKESEESELLLKCEPILLRIGHLFQMQDDFIDCFGDPSVTGKVGTDITDGKCCWPIVTALQICDKRQLEVLKNNYGIKCEDNERAVKQIYQELDVINVFAIKKNELNDSILIEIANLKYNAVSRFLKSTLDKIYVRIN